MRCLKRANVLLPFPIAYRNSTVRSNSFTMTRLAFFTSIAPQTPIQVLMFAVSFVSLLALSIHSFFKSQRLRNVLSLSTVERNVCFVWNCFFKPHTGDKTINQQDALERFYKAQASIYDSTRGRLLHGREDMLGLVAAQLKHRVETRSLRPRPIWVDVSLFSPFHYAQRMR